MNKCIFRILARVNRWLLPSMARRDLTRLPKWQKALVAYRYWVTLHALD